MKEILLKLANGDNSFDCTVFGQRRKCEILQLDLWGLKEDKGRAFVKIDEPVKKIVRRVVENTSFSMNQDYVQMEDVEVDTYEEWITIGY